MKNVITPQEAYNLLLFASDEYRKTGMKLCCDSLSNIYAKCINENLCYDFEINEFFKK